ncbi:MAG: AmmeMemoRadiSam system protein B [Gemmatimonadota bacterium]|jgi:AmmeMemoRadiSam system protein B
METLRKSAVAGHFYPSDPVALNGIVVELLAEVPREDRVSVGAVLPHAGLEYSGRCAAAVLGRVRIPGTVVILAPNHTGAGRSPAALWARGAFRTPLGDVAIDEDFAALVVAGCDLVADDPLAHRSEHAIEVELPFLQVRTPGVRVVPLVLAFEDWPRCRSLGRALAAAVTGADGDVLLLASSDMTHFEPAVRAARKDALALDAMRRLDGAALLEVCRHEGITMCGRGPAACVVEAARLLGASAGEVVDYRHSGQVTGDDESVVAYAGVILS